VLIAGVGNIFQGDDAFGVAVVHKLAGLRLPEQVRVMTSGFAASTWALLCSTTMT